MSLARSPVSVFRCQLPDLSIEPPTGVKFLVAVAVRSEVDGLLVSQAEKPGRAEAFIEEVMNACGERVIKVDQNVPAEHEMELIERAIGDQVVLRENDVLCKPAGARYP